MDKKSFSLFSDFRLTSTKLRLSDSDFVDRLNHYFASLVFCVSSIVICTHQYLVGDPLECWVPKEFSGGWEQYAENYCWVENTFFVKRNSSLKKDQHTELHYYQWVPFVLIIQALIFYLPYYVWRSLNWISGVDIRHMMLAALDASSVDKDKSKKAIDGLVDQYQESFLENNEGKYKIKSRYYLSICYIITKFLYIINTFVQFILMSSFLNTNFILFGIKILNNLANQKYWDETGLFPRTTFCSFDIRTINLDRPYTIQCVLVVNMLVEKVYIFLWFVLVFLFISNCYSFIQWFIWLLCSKKAILGNLVENSALNLSIWDKMNIDSLFVLRLLKKNCLGINYYKFMKKFSEKTILEDDFYAMKKIHK